MRLAWSVAFLLVSAWSHRARAEPDFARESAAWNGASRLLEVARERATVLAPEEVRLDRLRPDDALFLLAPDRPLPEGDLVEFVRHGGRLVIADDYGSGVGLFVRFGMRTSEPGATEAPRVRGEDALIVARPYYAHPLTEGVGVVVTNQPVLLEHPRLSPLIALEDGRPGVVVTGVVGEGRVVAIGDPSMFLNAMMELRGNRRLASNVVAFVTDGTPPRRLVVALPDTRIVGEFDADASGSVRERTERHLRSVAEARLPDLGVQMAAAVLAALSITLLSSMRGTRREPAMPWLESHAEASDPENERREVLRETVAQTLTRRLGLPRTAPRRDLMKALVTLGIRGDAGSRILDALDGRTDDESLRAAAQQVDDAFVRRDLRRSAGGDDTNGRDSR